MYSKMSASDTKSYMITTLIDSLKVDRFPKHKEAHAIETWMEKHHPEAYKSWEENQKKLLESAGYRGGLRALSDIYSKVLWSIARIESQDEVPPQELVDTLEYLDELTGDRRDKVVHLVVDTDIPLTWGMDGPERDMVLEKAREGYDLQTSNTAKYLIKRLGDYYLP